MSKIKTFLKSNYNLYSTIIYLCFVYYLLIKPFLNYSYYLSYNFEFSPEYELGARFMLLSMCVQNVWTAIRIHKKQQDSVFILTFATTGIIFCPVIAIYFEFNDLNWFYVFLIVTFNLLAYHFSLIKKYILIPIIKHLMK